MFSRKYYAFRTTNTTKSVMRLDCKNEQILHVYFVVKKKTCVFILYFPSHVLRCSAIF